MDSEHDARTGSPTSPSDVMQDLIRALSAATHSRRAYRIVGTAGAPDGRVAATMYVDAGGPPAKVTIEVSVSNRADVPDRRSS